MNRYFASPHGILATLFVIGVVYIAGCDSSDPEIQPQQLTTEDGQSVEFDGRANDLPCDEDPECNNEPIPPPSSWIESRILVPSGQEGNITEVVSSNPNSSLPVRVDYTYNGDPQPSNYGWVGQVGWKHVNECTSVPTTSLNVIWQRNLYQDPPDLTFNPGSYGLYVVVAHSGATDFTTGISGSDTTYKCYRLRRPISNPSVDLRSRYLSTTSGVVNRIEAKGYSSGQPLPASEVSCTWDDYGTGQFINGCGFNTSADVENWGDSEFREFTVHMTFPNGQVVTKTEVLELETRHPQSDCGGEYDPC